MSDLWEKVDTRTLKPGDVVVNYAGENVVWAAGDSQIVNDNPSGPWHIPCLFRRIPDAEDPQVLYKAIAKLHCELCSCIESKGGTPDDIPYYIDKARKELKSEDASDQA